MGDSELAHAAVAAAERLQVAVSTNGSFTRLSRCYSFSPHLTLRFGSILSPFPKPISCPRNLSQLSMGNGLSQCSAGAGPSAGIPLLQVLIWIASVPHWNWPPPLAISAAPLLVVLLFIKVLLLLHNHRLSRILKDICKVWMEVRNSKQDQMFTGKNQHCTSVTQCLGSPWTTGGWGAASRDSAAGPGMEMHKGIICTAQTATQLWLRSHPGEWESVIHNSLSHIYLLIFSKNPRKKKTASIDASIFLPG